MISINKIREKSTLLLIVVAASMLAFILGDYFSSRPNQRMVNIGTIYGEDIEAADFENLVAKEEQIRESYNQNIDENMREQIRTEVWNSLLREKILGKEIEELGLWVSPEEYDDIRFGNNVHPDFKNNSNFIDPQTGQFSPEAVKRQFSAMQEQFPLLWESQMKRIIETRKLMKYNNLIKKGVYVNSIQAESEFKGSNRKVSFNYAVGRYISIPDSTVKVTDDELQAYFNEHKKEVKYKQEEGRSIDYVIFEVKPSAEDIKATEVSIQALVEPFKTTADDSSFIVNNSQTRSYQPEIYTKGSAEPVIDSQIVSAPKGTVIGPYKSGDALRLVKIINNGQVPEVNARHILLKPSGAITTEQLKVKADSIMKAIEKNKNFADVARMISEDQGSASRGGDLDWFGEGMMVKPFEEAAFSTAKGGMKIVETQFGVHILEVTDKRSVDQIKLAVIQKPLVASSATKNAIYKEATAFSVNNPTLEQFNKAVEAKKLNKQTAPNVSPKNKFIPGIAEPGQILRWMFEAEEGAVSEPFAVGNQYVVAALTLITEEGEPSLAAVKDQMEREVLKEKKAKILLAKIKGNNLTSIASALGEPVQNATDITFNSPAIPGAGREPKVIGIVMTLPANAVSKPIIGENGVYVVQVTNIAESPAIKDLSGIRSNVASRLTSRAENSVYSSLLDLANVKDFRYKYY